MYALILLFLMTSTSAFSAVTTATTKLPGKKSLVSIEKISSESNKDQSIVTIAFTGKPEEVKPVQEHGSFVQILVPNAVVPNPGQFFDGHGEHVAKIAAFQLTPKDAGIRVFLTTPAARIMKATSIDVLDKRIVFMIDHEKIIPADQQTNDIVKLDQKELKNAQLQKAETNVADIIANADREESSIPPSQLVQQEKSLTPGPLGVLGTRSTVDMRAQLIKAGAFSVLMLGLLALTLWLKWRQKRRISQQVGDAVVTMKTLATMSVASKQRLSLVQIGDEKILLGISPDQVTFLTAIKSETGQAYSNPQPAKIPLPAKNTREWPSFVNLLTSEEEYSEDPATVNHSSAAPLLDMLDMASAHKQASNSTTMQPPKGHQPQANSVSRGSSLASSDAQQNPMPNMTRAVKSTIKPSTKPRIPKAPSTSSFQVAVGDDGISAFTRKPTATATAKANQLQKVPSNREPETIDDITKLIREKLRTYRKI